MTQRLRQAGLPLMVVALVATWVAAGQAQAPAPSSGPSANAPMPVGTVAPAAAGVAPPATNSSTPAPADYVIGADDILTVRVWQDEKMSGDVVVRPDGKITLALINDIQAAGLTPEQFRAAVAEAAGKFIEGPTVNVIIKQINSRRVYVTGEVGKPGPYALTGKMTVLQMLTLAGGVTEFADKSNIGIFRTDNGKPVRLRFNYNDVMDGKNLQQNIELRVGDTIVVKD